MDLYLKSRTLLFCITGAFISLQNHLGNGRVGGDEDSRMCGKYEKQYSKSYCTNESLRLRYLKMGGCSPCQLSMTCMIDKKKTFASYAAVDQMHQQVRLETNAMETEASLRGTCENEGAADEVVSRPATEEEQEVTPHTMTSISTVGCCSSLVIKARRCSASPP